MRLFGDAGAAAVLYVVVQTGTVFALAYALFCERQATGAGLVQLLYHVEQRIHRAYMTVGAVEGAEFLVYHPRLEYSRIKLLGDADRGICLAVLEQNVVFRLVFLYKVVFEQQRILLGVYHGVCDVPYLAHEHLCLVAVHFLMEIR